MRILRLELIAFGPFTNAALEFSHDRDALEIVYGDNESGKSSALRAVTDLLYGIPGNTQDNFLHNNRSLRIGGLLRHSDGTEMAFVRKKGTKNTVLGADGEPIRDDVLDMFLAGVTDNVFMSLFGIGHEELLRGGRDIAAGRGEVGQALFSAGLGGVRLRAVLRQLESEADGLFRMKGSKPHMNKLISKYRADKERIARVSLSGREWTNLTSEFDKIERDLGKLSQELADLSREKERLERLSKALPKIALRGELLERMESLGNVTVLPEEFGSKRRDAVQQLEGALEAKQQSITDIEKLSSQFEDLDVSEGLLEEADAIEAIREDLAVQRKAAKDMGKLEGDYQAHRTTAEAILSELHPGMLLDEADNLRLTVSQRVGVQELGNRHEVLLDNLRRAEETCDRVKIGLDDARLEMDGLENARDTLQLSSAVNQARKTGDLQSTRCKIMESLREEEDQIGVDLERLGLWAGTIEDLEKLTVPAVDTVERFEEAFRENASAQSTVEANVQKTEEERDEVQQRIAELEMSGTVPSEQELDGAREKRDMGWRLVRRAWLEGEDVSVESNAYDASAPLSEAYEKNVGLADEAADRLRREADRVAGRASLVARTEPLSAQLEKLAQRGMALSGERDQLERDWSATWQPTGLSPLTPREMRSWLGNWKGLAQRSERLRGYRRDLDNLDDAVGRHLEGVNSCLEALGEEPFGPDSTLDTVLELCQTMVDRINDSNKRRNELHRSISKLEIELTDSRHQKEKSEADLARWHEEWALAVAALGLREDASPLEANTVMGRLDEFFNAWDKAASAKERVDAIRASAKRFEKEVRALVGRLAVDIAGLPADQAAAEIASRLSKNRTGAATIAQLKERVEEKREAQRKSEDTIKVMTQRLEAMCQKAGCQTWEELEELEQRSSEFRDLQKRVVELDEQLRMLTGGGTLVDLLEASAQSDADSLPAEIDEKTGAIGELGDELGRLRERKGGITAQLEQMGGTGAAAEAQQGAADALAEIRPLVDQYVRLRMGRAMLQHAIERYRQDSQGWVLSRASDLLSQLTLGSFSSLEIEVANGNGSLLVGVRPTGKRVGVEDMSDGTVDQLYLSLRLATLEMYLRNNESMPFIVDDILIRFDDSRAYATIEALARLSEMTQVIFFTHHSRLVELAEAAIPARRLHVSRV